jgi:hypothetical protein
MAILGLLAGDCHEGYDSRLCGAYRDRWFSQLFNDLKDPLQRGKVIYPLEEILLLCLLAVLAGAETVTDIALFGQKKLALLRRFRPFKDGTPAPDHLGDILATLDAEQFQRCFVAWMAALTGTPEGVAPSTARPRDDPAGRPAATRQPIWSRPSRPASGSCSAR